MKDEHSNDINLQDLPFSVLPMSLFKISINANHKNVWNWLKVSYYVGVQYVKVRIHILCFIDTPSSFELVFYQSSGVFCVSCVLIKVLSSHCRHYLAQSSWPCLAPFTTRDLQDMPQRWTTKGTYYHKRKTWKVRWNKQKKKTLQYSTLTNVLFRLWNRQISFISFVKLLNFFKHKVEMHKCHSFKSKDQKIWG